MQTANPKPEPTNRVALVHMPYHVRGGEDAHVDSLRQCYAELGMECLDFVAELPELTEWKAASASLRGGQSADWDAWLARRPVRFFHLHNIHPRLGPAFLRWLVARKLPALMTVHNHRFYCTNGLALYQGEVCKTCRPLEALSLSRPVLRNCNDSLSKSIYHSMALREIRAQDLWNRAVSAFLAPSPYIARELQSAGIAATKIRLLPHGVDLAQLSQSTSVAKTTDVIFVGRLSEEKGVRVLLEATRKLPETQFTLVGEGPLAEEVLASAANAKNIRYLGKLGRAEMLAALQAAKVACVPSLCHESFSLVAAEALSLGLQLVVADSESLAHFLPAPLHAFPARVRDSDRLASTLRQALAAPSRRTEEIQAIRAQFSLALYSQRLQSLLQEWKLI